MKKLLYFMTSSLVALTVSGSVLAAETGAGNINFTGKIIAASCNVSIDGNAGGAVNLGQWPTSTFREVGDKTIPQPFTLSVSDCAQGEYKFNFTGQSDESNPDLLKVSNATGVAIAITHAGNESQQIKLNTLAGADSKANVSIGENATTASLPLQAFYRSTASTVTSGDANATVRVTLQQK